MKTIAALALVLLTANFAQAYDPACGPSSRRDINGHPGDFEALARRTCKKPLVSVACAPEVVQGNVAATERTLAEVAATPEFASATEFKAKIASIGASKDQDAKVSKYLALIGVDASKSAEVVEFVGAREVKAQYLSSLERSTNLSSAQADIVARKLQTTLRGSLQ